MLEINVKRVYQSMELCEQHVLAQNPPLLNSSFSMLCKPCWPRKMHCNYVRPITNHWRDQFKQ